MCVTGFIFALTSLYVGCMIVIPKLYNKDSLSTCCMTQTQRKQKGNTAEIKPFPNPDQRVMPLDGLAVKRLMADHPLTGSVDFFDHVFPMTKASH